MLRLICDNDIDPRTVGLLALGTESSTDNSAGAVIVRGMVDRELESRGLPRLSRTLEVPELKHACLGGVYALKGALRYVSFDGAARRAIVVAADIAEYERGSTGEPTQGAGACALLVERKPKLLAAHLAQAGYASSYRGPDFRKPFARRLTPGYAQQTRRISDFPVFSGRYSTLAYIDQVVCAVEDMLEKMSTSAHAYYQDVGALFFHRPYDRMPTQAMSVLYFRALARSTAQSAKFEKVCEAIGVAVDEATREIASDPNLYQPIHEGAAPEDPYPIASQGAAFLRKDEGFQQMVSEKMCLGSARMKELGNMYSAALLTWVAAGLHEAHETGALVAGQAIGVIGYGSGDAAEAIPMTLVDGWEEAAAKVHFVASVGEGVDLSREQYEALHDGLDCELPAIPEVGRFVIDRIGSRYERDFQDLCVEYYEYLPPPANRL